MANLDGATQIRLGYICIISPRVAKESTARVAVMHVFQENNSAKMLVYVSITLERFFA